MQGEFICARLLEKLWARIAKTETHWWWIGGRFRNGYGRVCVGRDCRGVHRVVWEIVHGPIPPGMVVCHTCDADFPPGDITYRACCNPAHLFLGTLADNSADMKRKGRSAAGDRNTSRLRPDRQVRGERNHSAKLTADQVRAIRARHAQGGVLQRELAEEYGVDVPAINKIVLGYTWKHVT